MRSVKGEVLDRNSGKACNQLDLVERASCVEYKIDSLSCYLSKCFIRAAVSKWDGTM